MRCRRRQAIRKLHQPYGYSSNLTMIRRCDAYCLWDLQRACTQAPLTSQVGDAHQDTGKLLLQFCVRRRNSKPRLSTKEHRQIMNECMIRSISQTNYVVTASKRTSARIMADNLEYDGERARWMANEKVRRIRYSHDKTACSVCDTNDKGTTITPHPQPSVGTFSDSSKCILFLSHCRSRPRCFELTKYLTWHHSTCPRFYTFFRDTRGAKCDN
jgi:hypothetical protein